MSPLSERLFAGLARACALLVAMLPVAAGATLVWFSIRAVLRAPDAGVADGVGALLASSLFIGAGAAAIGGGSGIGCALAAEELAPAPMRGAIQGAIGFLGAVPAVVFGWFAAVLVSRPFAHGVPNAQFAYAAATAILAAMAAPTACALTSRALRRIPDGVRHAAAAAGASRLQTMAIVVIPALRSQIAAAGLAAFARAATEATALQILIAAISRLGGVAPATAASRILAAATTSPAAAIATQLCLPALVLFVLAAACALAVGRAYRGLQWA